MVFKNLGFADSIGDGDFAVPLMKAFVAGPFLREGAEVASVHSDEAFIVEGAGFGIGPSGAVCGLEKRITYRAGANNVSAVEINPAPVNEALAGPGSGDAQGIVLEGYPGIALRYAAGG